MRYTISSQQFDHFRQEEWVELEGLFSEEEIVLLKGELDRALSTRTGAGEKTLEEKFRAGHDLERENPPLKKAVHPSRIGQIGSPLFKQKWLRIAFTQYMLGYPNPASLEEISSVTETCGGLLLTLEGEQGGNGLFVGPQFTLSFPLEIPLLLIAFSTEKGRYRHQEKDPHTHFLKKLGYAFGDRLTTDTHPLITR